MTEDEEQLTKIASEKIPDAVVRIIDDGENPQGVEVTANGKSVNALEPRSEFQYAPNNMDFYVPMTRKIVEAWT